MHLATCPSPANLERLFLGGLPEKEVEALEQHVLGCRECGATLEQLLRTRETLADVLRDPTRTDTPPAPLVLDDLMKKLETLRPVPARPPNPGTAQEPPAQPPAHQTDVTLELGAHHDASLTDFLAPPQANDELGRLGKYRILKILGHGGMGVVYQAEDPKLKRSVALKAMLPTLAASASAGQRFLREAQAMAAVEHDHIVRIYQVDEERGVPFLAMEFLKGEALDARLQRDDQLPVGEVLRIGREIAEALVAAHGTGLIHRDIKPANVWLEAPRNRVKILDFGLARAAAQDAGLSQQGTIVGTPAYMAPEQARGDTVDARCDLFSLGVVLYRLCSGRQPFVGKDSVSTLVEVTMHEPAPPIQINAEVPRGLSDLVMKLLEKDPAKRFASAAEVVQAIQHLERVPAISQPDVVQVVQAPALHPRPAPAAPRRGKRRLAVWTVVLLGVLGLGATAAGVVVYRIQTDHGELTISTDNPDVEIIVRQGGKEVTILDTRTKKEFTLHAGVYDLEMKDPKDGLKLEPEQVTIRRGETVLATITQTKKAAPVVALPKPPAKAELLYTLPWMDEQQRFPAHLWYTRISADGRLFLAGGDTGPAGAIRVCNLATGRQVQVLVLGGDPWFFSAMFRPGSEQIVASYNQMKDLYLWDIQSGQVIRKFVGHEKPGPDFTVSPDGKRILSWGADKTVRLWDVETGEQLRQLEGHTDAAAGGVFSPDGQQVLTFSPDKTLRLWSVETGKELKKLEGLTNPATGCFSPDGKQALSYSSDGTIWLWDLATGKKIRECEGPKDHVCVAGFVADGRLVVAVPTIGKSALRKFRIWETSSGKLVREIDLTPFGPEGGTFTATPDGRQGLVGDSEGAIRVIDLITGKETHRFDKCPMARAFSIAPDGTTGVAGSFRAGVFVFRLAAPPADGGWKLGGGAVAPATLPPREQQKKLVK